MTTIRITTDAASQEFEGCTADEAAAAFAAGEHMAGVESVGDLMDRLESLGGYGNVSVDGEIIAEVPV